MEHPKDDGRIEPEPAVERSPSPEPAKRVTRRGRGEPYIPMPEEAPPTPRKARSWLIAVLAAALAVGLAVMKSRTPTPPPHQATPVEAPAR